MFDPAGHHTPEVPPIPMVIDWDQLDPAGYEHTLTALADWITWLQRTFRIPGTVIPPCWYAHPGHVEDLGHLWSGWLLTRHPDAGVGMTGLDWDTRRDQAIPRLRDATAITGCTTTRHHPDPEGTSIRDERSWRQHLDAQQRRRRERDIHAAAVAAVIDHLQAAEHRDELAPGVLLDVADHPTAPTDDDITAVADELRAIAEHAVHTAHQVAADATDAAAAQHDHAAGHLDLNLARHALARTLVQQPPSAGADHLDSAARTWMATLETTAPAANAAHRTTAHTTIG